MARQISKGRCSFCHAEYSKLAMTRHLATCKQQAHTNVQTEDHQAILHTKTLHLLVEGRSLPMYWMHLKVTNETTLARLDQFLREIWLECCGHLSAFEIGGFRYTVDAGLFDDDFWGRRQKNMHISLSEVLQPGQTCTYEYDFGSTTELALKVIAQREETAQEKPIQVIARNNPEPISCSLCGNPAVMMCSQCLYAGKGNLCDACAMKHPCGEEMRLPLVNSPRAGVCGYIGEKRTYHW